MEPQAKTQHIPAHDGVALKRGRPPSSKNRRVIEDILRAANTCLEHKSPHRITVSDVAALAHTRPAMVYYYFGDMQGLLTEILERSLQEIMDDTENLHEAIRNGEVANPLRAMIGTFAKAYNERPALMRILISELLRDDSRMHEVFLNKWPAFGKLMMDDVILRMSAAGHYRRDIDVERIGALIRGAVFFPLIIKPYLSREGDSIERYLDDSWIDFVTEVVERYLLPAGR